MVNAIYTDNNQRFSDDYHGDSALEAQIACQLERLSDSGWITEVEISCVIDRKTGKVADQEAYSEEAGILTFTQMLARLVRLASPHPGQPPQQGIEAAEEFDRRMRALEFWTAISRSKAQQTAREHLDEMYNSSDDEYEEGDTLFTDSRGVQDSIDVRDAFEVLVEMAGTGLDLSKPGNGPKDTGIFQVLQGKCTLEYFGDRLSQVLNDWEVESV